MQKRLAIVTTHPIQYNAPLFTQLSADAVSFTLKVFYTWSQAKETVFDKEFGRAVKWDIPLLDGYEYTFVHNSSKEAGSHHFKGIVNPSLIKEIEAWQADAVLVYGWSFESHLKALRYFHGKIPVLFRGDSTLIDEPATTSLKKMARRVFLRWVYSKVDYALYVGSANKQYFAAHGLKERQLVFAPHAIDNDRFSLEETYYTSEAKKWRQELGISDNEVVFLFAAKLTTKKDPELLIRAFLLLNDPAARLIIVGNGELETSLKERYGNHAAIAFIGFQNQSIMPVVYRLGDVFVLSSKGPGETWGLAVNEAMASGRGVIVSNKCGCATDLVKEGETGYVFKTGDMEQLKRVMQLATNNFIELGINARSFISDWNFYKTIEQLEVFFEHKIGK